jgi:NAD(P)H-hydrate epimerase
MDERRLTRAQSRELDRRAIEEYGISGLVLMENAGRGCVDVLERLGIDGPVLILCGKGNNAGDGFVIARHLEIRGHAGRVLLLCAPDELRGDAAANFAILRNAGTQFVDLSPRAGAAAAVAGLATEPPSRPPLSGVEANLEASGQQRAGSRDPRITALAEALDEHLRDADWIVDALLGTGAQGDPRPPFDAAIEAINRRPAGTRVLAVDVPSGLDCDTGHPSAHTVRADHTCTFAAMKIGFTQPAAKEFTGTVHVCDVGVPPRLIEDVPSTSGR